VSKDKVESGWKLKYWCDDNGQSDIEEWLDALSKDQLKSVARELLLLESCGNQLRLPHSRSLKKGLFELRDRQNNFRIYYTFLPKNIIMLLNAGNKKTQDKDIKIARQRLDAIN